jgi:hypothetical protein
MPLAPQLFQGLSYIVFRGKHLGKEVAMLGQPLFNIAQMKLAGVQAAFYLPPK